MYEMHLFINPKCVFINTMVKKLIFLSYKKFFSHNCYRRMQINTFMFISMFFCVFTSMTSSNRREPTHMRTSFTVKLLVGTLQYNIHVTRWKNISVWAGQGYKTVVRDALY